MEDKRTEAEKCNGWLRKVSAFYLCVFYCGGEGYYDDDLYDYYKRSVKEKFSPLVSNYLKSFESNDTKQRKEAILSVINYFDKDLNNDDYPIIYQFTIGQCRKDYFKSPNNIRIEDPRLLWFRKLVEEDISGVEMCRMLLTCLELGEFEIGISLGQEYIRNNENHSYAELSISLVNKHIEVLQEELSFRQKREALAVMDSMDITDYRDYRRELEEDSQEAMTGGMYGDYDGDIDMDKLGY